MYFVVCIVPIITDNFALYYRFIQMYSLKVIIAVCFSVTNIH